MTHSRHDAGAALAAAIDLPDCITRRRADAFRNRINNRFTSALDDGQAVITIYDEIGFYGVTASDVRRKLDSLTADRIVLRINSPGGDVFDGIAIYNDLLQHDADVSVEITGLAASAASIIAMAGDTVRMAETAFLMIHNSWGLVVGNKGDMRAFADTLEQIDGAIATAYAKRAGIDIKSILDMMDAETWLVGSDAIEQGFADELLAAGDDEPKALFDLSTFERVPAALKRQIENDLRDEGFSANEARHAVADGFNCLAGRDVPGAESGERDVRDTVGALSELAADLRRLSNR